MLAVLSLAREGINCLVGIFVLEIGCEGLVNIVWLAWDLVHSARYSSHLPCKRPLANDATLGNALVYNALVLPSVGIVDGRANVDEFIEYFDVIILHEVGFDFLCGSQYCISHIYNK